MVSLSPCWSFCVPVGLSRIVISTFEIFVASGLVFRWNFRGLDIVGVFASWSVFGALVAVTPFYVEYATGWFGILPLRSSSSAKCWMACRRCPTTVSLAWFLSVLWLWSCRCPTPTSRGTTCGGPGRPLSSAENLDGWTYSVCKEQTLCTRILLAFLRGCNQCLWPVRRPGTVSQPRVR